MLREYHASRQMGGDNPLGVGTVAIGTIFYLQDDGWWRARFRGQPICRNPWMVVAFINGTLGAARRDPTTGHWTDLYMANRCAGALVRSLRDGRIAQVTTHTLLVHAEAALDVQPSHYPTRPPLQLHPRFRQPVPNTVTSAHQDRPAA